MQIPDELKERPTARGPNSTTQGISSFLEKNSNPDCFMFENIYKGRLGFY